MINCDAMSHITTKYDMIRLSSRRMRMGNVKNVMSEYGNIAYKKLYSERIKNLCNRPVFNVKGHIEAISINDLLYINALKTYLREESLFTPPEQKNKYLEQLKVFYDKEE